MAIEFTFSSVVANAGRLRILAALARESGQEFVRLREMTRLTDGNLSAHARRLAEAGLVLIEKRFKEGKPVTTFSITQSGKYAIKAHAQELLEAVEEGDANDGDGEWVD
jgi:DNA-binding MarR family transcriptional regulator